MVAGSVLMYEAEYTSWPVYQPCLVEESGMGVRLLMTNPLLARDYGWTRIAREFPEARAAFREGGGTERMVERLADLLRRRFTLTHLEHCSFPGLDARIRMRGLVGIVGEGGVSSPPPGSGEVDGWFRRMRLRGLFGPEPPRDETVTTVLEPYMLLASLPGEGERVRGNVKGAVGIYRRALRFPGRQVRAQVLQKIGLGEAILGNHREAGEAFLEAARIRRTDADLWLNSGVALLKQGRKAEAASCLESALRLAPGSQAVQSALRDALSP